MRGSIPGKCGGERLQADVGRREHARAVDHARQSTPRMRACGERRTDEVDVERVLELEVLDVVALAGEEARILLAQDALSHKTRHALTSTSGRAVGRLAVPVLPRDHRVAQHADLLDLGLHHVAGLQVQRRRVRGEPGHARHGSRREHVSRGVSQRRVVGDDLRDRHGHPAGVGRLPRLAVHAQLHRQVVRVGDLVRRHDPRAERAERVDRLAEREHARLHLSPLDVAGGDVVEDHVAGDVVIASSGPNHLPSLPITTASSSS